MKRAARLAVFFFAATASVWFGLRNIDSSWQGVDETVVERFAREAGRSARRPYIDTDQGDLLLFVFLIAGAVGGFVGGYCFRELFGRPQEESANV